MPRILDATWVIFPDELLKKMVKLEQYNGKVVDNPSSLPDSLKKFSGTITSWAPNSRLSGNMLDLVSWINIGNNDAINNLLVDMSNLTANKDSEKTSWFGHHLLILLVKPPRLLSGSWNQNAIILQ